MRQLMATKASRALATAAAAASATVQEQVLFRQRSGQAAIYRTTLICWVQNRALLPHRLIIGAFFNDFIEGGLQMPRNGILCPRHRNTLHSFNVLSR